MNVFGFVWCNNGVEMRGNNQRGQFTLRRATGQDVAGAVYFRLPAESVEAVAKPFGPLLLEKRWSGNAAEL